MRIVLVGPEIEENLSMRYLASALLRARHECTIVPFSRTKQIRCAARRALARKPDLIGLALCAFGCDHTEAADPLPPPPARFATDIEPRLHQTCTAAGCHAAQSPAAGLTLTAGQSYANLVNVPSVQVPEMDRVTPYSEDSSYVIHKLLGDQQTVGGSGDRMPKGQEPDSGLLNKMADWIGRGAKND